MIFLCMICATAHAADPPAAARFSPDAAGLYQSAAQIAPPANADLLFLEDEETLILDADGKAVRSRYFLYKILTRRGAESWTMVSCSWEPWHEDRPVLRARVITPDNAVHLLDEKTITDAPARESEDNVFSDRRVLRAPLPAIAPGSLVEEEQTSTETMPFFGAGTVEQLYFGSSVPLHHVRLVLDAPSSLPIRYELRLLPDLKAQRTEADGRVRIIFDSGPVDAIDEVENELPSDVPSVPSIIFSTGKSWQQVAEEYSKIVDKQLATADLKSLVAGLTAKKHTRDEKTVAILQYVSREIRYTGVEFGDATFVPWSPTETLTRKYGDCKDKSALLVAMLRTANIPAYVALLNAGSREDVAADLPGMGMFDHAIVYIPGTPDIWIDATDEYARLGETPNADQERLALIARPGTNSLTRTPSASSKDNTLFEKREIFLAENGPARIIETSQPHGSDQSSYRHYYVDKGNKNTKDNLTDYVKSQYLAEKLDRMDRSDPNDLSKQFELVIESDRAKRGATDLNVAAAGIRLEGLFDRLPAELRQREKEEDPKADASQKPKKKRTADFELPQAFVTEWQYTITPPPGFQPKPLPQNAELSVGPAKLTEEFSTDPTNIVHAAFRFDTVKRRLTASEGTDLRNKVAQVMEGEPILIYFEPAGQVLLNQGKIGEALKSYRGLIALHPKEAVHHLQLAQAFLLAGLGEPARGEAQAAVKIEPSSALAEKTLADILEYDSVGRKMRPGSDYAGAEAAFRAAIALDPDDKTNLANLAVLFEYNQWGLRYGPGSRLKDALTEYRKLSTGKIAEYGMQNNIPFALFYDGQFAEAEKEAQPLNPQPLALIVACEGALNGSHAALTEARKRTGSEDQFKKIAEAAGQMLINLRKYSIGADLEEAGASGNTASDTAAFVSLYRKTIPHEQLQLADDPTGVVLRFEILASDPALTLDQLRSISSRNGAKALVDSELLEDTVKRARGLLSLKARTGEFSNVGFDLSLSRAQPSVQGNDATGYKVILWPNATYKRASYVVKEDGHYKLLNSVGGIGMEILDRLAAKDLPGARVLLDWLREDWHLVGGDDPLSSAAFPRIWTRGQDADVAHMKIAAAALLVFDTATAPAGISILETATNSASTDAEKVNIMLALRRGYVELYNSERAASASAYLAGQYPDSESAFQIWSFHLRALGRFDQAEAIAQQRLQRLPGDLSALRTEINIATARGNYAKVRALSQGIIDLGKAEPQDLNTTAWYSLFTGKVQPSDLEIALKAVQLSNNNTNMLHTLACVYAELGKTKEAREVLVQGMDTLNLDEPDSDYWYAFGRIAEQYGERDVALADYNRVEKPKRAMELPGSSYQLAQIRLQAMKSEKTREKQ